MINTKSFACRSALLLWYLCAAVAVHAAESSKPAFATKPTWSPTVAQTLGLAKSEDDVVDPERAFRVEVVSVGESALNVRFIIDDCCYLYRDKMRFALGAADGKPQDKPRLGAYELPPGDVMTDEFFGKTEVYRRAVTVYLPVAGGALGAGAVLNVSYQGCAEKGVKICYPPTTRTLAVTTGSITADGSFVWAMLTAFAGGLLLTFTPCVLPMIPILSGVIVGTEGARLTKLRGGALSYAYVAGTALTYTVAGAIAGSTGDQLQAYFQNPWAIGIFTAVIVLLALSMFGLYELRLPSSIQTLLHHRSQQLHRKAKRGDVGEFVGVFVLGAVSALIIGACVAPVLAFALATAIATHDPWLGAGIMFALAHGQGVFLVALGIGGGALLPRSGPWMQIVKYVFGVLLLAVAIYLLGFVPTVPVLFLWAALLIVTAVYLGATQRVPQGAGGWRYLWKGVGTVLLIWGVLALIGAFAGNRDIRNPLPLWFAGQARVATGPSAMPTASLFTPVKTVGEVERLLADARAAGKPAILDYYATWCNDCVRMENSTFLDPRVRAAVADRFVSLQADVTDPNDPDGRALKRRFAVYGPPAVLVFTRNGEERRDLRLYGYKSSDEFLALLAEL